MIQIPIPAHTTANARVNTGLMRTAHHHSKRKMNQMIKEEKEGVVDTTYRVESLDPALWCLHSMAAQ